MTTTIAPWARVCVPVNGVEERLGDGLEKVLGRAVPGYPSVLVTLDRSPKENT
jgi:hypothetical protein